MKEMVSFTDYLATHKGELLPHGIVPLKPNSFDASVLTSNDIIPRDLITTDKPNGTLFGLGFGGVFGMVDFFEDKHPEQILLFDVTPEPIEVGQICLRVMRQQPEFRSFLNIISQDIYPLDLQEGKRIAQTAARLYRLRSEDPRVFALEHIKRNYAVLHGLAREDKIHIGYGDMFSPATVTTINHFKNPDKRHLFYVTDAPQFGLDKIEVVAPALKNTWFVDTETPYNTGKGKSITMCRATYEKLPIYDEEYRSYLR